ncbi:glycosyltransferase [candidate division KSB1 bacterium]|nr:glycosyltransferase [candidate division KSB1 bacterium]
MDQSDMKDYFDAVAPHRLKWKKRNKYYHSLLEKYYQHLIPEGKKVIELGCGTGELLAAVKPSYGVGIDFSKNMIELAKKQFPDLEFFVMDIEQLSMNQKFDYIIISDLLCSLHDVQVAIGKLHLISHPKTRIIISNYNYLWEPVLRTGEKLGIKAKQPAANWLSSMDIENILELENFEIIGIKRKILCPKFVPFISAFLNIVIANLPLLNRLNLVNFIIAREKEFVKTDASVSIVIPARNEKGNIEDAVIRIPCFGTSQEIIFIEGNSSDGTYDEMLRVKEKYFNKNIIVMKQSAIGKGNAVREAFDIATGQILMILDADLTVPPEDLPKFYYALINNKADFVNGCRLVYPMEKQAMRFLNLAANKFFSLLFSYLLSQRLKDTLCGTKVLYSEDYVEIKSNRHYFGDFDPFGDFDLLFGAAKLNLKIVDVIIRYKERQYGTTQISRFKHGWLLFRMSLFAARKLKFF